MRDELGGFIATCVRFVHLLFVSLSSTTAHVTAVRQRRARAKAIESEERESVCRLRRIWVWSSPDNQVSRHSSLDREQENVGSVTH